MPFAWGIILISKGYAELKQTPTLVYVLPAWMNQVAFILLLPTFVLFAASFFPGRISAAVKHPQLSAVKLWALAHLLVNGLLADVLLFGAFLLWAIANRISMKSRPSRPTPRFAKSNLNDGIAIVIGLGLYALIVFWLHESLLGVKPVF